MIVTEVKNLPQAKNPHNVDSRIVYSTEKAMIVHIELKPGESLKRHITPVDVAFYVLEGKGIIEIGDERKEVGANTMVESPAKVPHRWLNESGSVLRVLVIKLPRPTENTIVL
jgi:mannose-6-phosphate isomerase-like protein (cupin superfamily)